MSTSLAPFSSSIVSRKPSQTKSSVAKPSTPAKPSQPLETPSPGLWKHPKFQEIAKRQKQSTFDGDNIKTILWNSLAFLVAWLLRSSLSSISMVRDGIVSPMQSLIGDTPIHILHLILAFNVCQALLPLFRGKDNLSDIDLTASQRSLLGLDPNATPPATPTTKYITPPRYARSTTPHSGTPSSRGSSPAGSPLAYKASPLMRHTSGSVSPQVTPLWQKAIGNSGSRRSSFGFPSTSASPLKDSSIFAPQTPSPIGRSSGVPISSKWIYHRGRSMSASKGIF